LRARRSGRPPPPGSSKKRRTLTCRRCSRCTGAGVVTDAVLGLAHRIVTALRRPSRTLSIAVAYSDREFDVATLGREISELLSDRATFPTIDSVAVTLPAGTPAVGIAVSV
jgi:hypothetical protein